MIAGCSTSPAESTHTRPCIWYAIPIALTCSGESLAKQAVHSTWSAASAIHLAYVLVVASACSVLAISRMRASVYK